MKLGISLPQGCDREYIGLSPADAWRRTVEIAQLCEEAGFESLWINDHFQVDPPVIEAPIFEPFVELAGLAMATRRARLGHLVLAAAYRNPALTAKAISSVDVLSGGRAVLGIGAGWKQDEWIAYGYGFPDVRTRLAIFRDHLEVISRMLAPGRATYRGEHAHVIDAVHEPKGFDGPVPILIGGNGPEVTWRLAARFAAELNLDARMPAQVVAALPVIRERCEEIGRDPASLKVSVYLWGPPADVSPGRQRVERLLEYAETGLDLAIVQGFMGTTDPAALDSLIDDCQATGLLRSG
jgi:alkanesulfonate monooxygenase SsuD/methylene tetrahydromethanopterin reductase-like flavin-dependent oxidoreductase (luciferase family)